MGYGGNGQAKVTMRDKVGESVKQLFCDKGGGKVKILMLAWRRY